MLENSLRLQKVLPLKFEEASMIARAYDVDEIKMNFLTTRYRPSINGIDPVVSFAFEVMNDEEYREKCNGLLSCIEEVKIPRIQCVHF